MNVHIHLILYKLIDYISFKFDQSSRIATKNTYWLSERLHSSHSKLGSLLVVQMVLNFSMDSFVLATRILSSLLHVIPLEIYALRYLHNSTGSNLSLPYFMLTFTFSFSTTTTFF